MPDHDHACCEWCCDECNPTEENYDEDDSYDEEEDDMPGGWGNPPTTASPDIDGKYMRPTRTVGVEYEMVTYDGDWGSNWRERVRSFGSGIGSDHCGVEVRTPPVKGAQADDVLAGTLTAMLEGGHRPGPAAGLHVHVHVPEAMQGDYYYSDRRYDYATSRYEMGNGNDPEKATAFARLYALWYAAEHVTYRFDPSRRRNTYSTQLFRNRADRITAVEDALACAQRGEVPNVQSGRYNSMNVSGGYGTVEFRNHGSSDNVPHVMAWIAFCQGMVDLSQKVSFITIKRIARAKSHNERARLLMNAARRHGVFTPAAYSAIMQELGLRKQARDLPGAVAA